MKKGEEKEVSVTKVDPCDFLVLVAIFGFIFICKCVLCILATKKCCQAPGTSFLELLLFFFVKNFQSRLLAKPPVTVVEFFIRRCW